VGENPRYGLLLPQAVDTHEAMGVVFANQNGSSMPDLPVQSQKRGRCGILFWTQTSFSNIMVAVTAWTDSADVRELGSTRESTQEKVVSKQNYPWGFQRPLDR
jgi:hypothetical protein